MPPTQAKNPYANAIFWVDVEKIVPNPYQPRREFDEQALRELSESIKQYGILQPLTVSRIENWNEDGSLNVTYELIAGERRLRASKLGGLTQVPVIIRVGDDSKAKLELAILENLQREDLNPVDRAKAFAQLSSEFSLKHGEIGQKMGKSREYVSNTLRLLMLPEDVLNALAAGKISEGHTRPLMMLMDRPEEQLTLFKEMLLRKMTVREAEGIARRIAYDKVRKKDRFFDPDIAEIEGSLAETLGTRVHIEKREVGGKISIDFFSYEELQSILDHIKTGTPVGKTGMREMINRVNPKDMMVAVPIIPAVLDQVAPQHTLVEAPLEHPLVINSESEHVAVVQEIPSVSEELTSVVSFLPQIESTFAAAIPDSAFSPQDSVITDSIQVQENLVDDRSKEEVKKEENSDDPDLYNINNFVV